MALNIDKDTRAAQARAFFKGGYNCCQSVAMAYADVLGLDKDTVAMLASGFGGGFARMREVCGCVSGMTMVAGALRPATNPSVRTERTANYALVQELADEFRKMNGSIVCRELLGLDRKRESPQPSERTAEYYKKRPCEEMVGIAAGILADKISSLENAGQKDAYAE